MKVSRLNSEASNSQPLKKWYMDMAASFGFLYKDVCHPSAHIIVQIILPRQNNVFSFAFWTHVVVKMRLVHPRCRQDGRDAVRQDLMGLVGEHENDERGAIATRGVTSGLSCWRGGRRQKGH